MVFYLNTYNQANDLFLRLAAPKPNKPKADDIRGNAAGNGTDETSGLFAIVNTSKSSILKPLPPKLLLIELPASPSSKGLRLWF